MADLAPLKPQVYTDPRPKEHFDRFHRRARTAEPDFAYELTRLVTSLYAYTLLRVRAIGAERVPGTGPVILAPNHASFMDHFIVGCYLRRKIRFMAKSQLFKQPLQFIYSHGGVFPVRRGARDEEAFITAKTLLARGCVVLMYPEGGRSRTGRLAERAKPGVGRLALESGAPVVPIAVHGSTHIRNWRRGRFPKVTVLYGHPYRYRKRSDPPRELQQAVADDVLARIRALYNQLVSEGRKAALRRRRPAEALAGGR